MLYCSPQPFLTSNGDRISRLYPRDMELSARAVLKILAELTALEEKLLGVLE
ncbi:hypothetical protein [Calothrix rhizosoleniae]|uniref:hypothetical protein n=1 Tax=Calothrix rhizosoleniae TaxID=888997 RepID=UPI0013566D50|nr:hypothetical protein [Calothrix rhizosoleniae]